MVSFVDDRHQRFKARIGTDLHQTPRDVAFCAYTILSDDVLWVEDACADPRFSDSTLVTQDPHFRFYAGAPIHGPGGQRLGAVCVVGPRPRQRDEAAGAALIELAAQAGTALAPRALLADELALQVTGLSVEIDNLWSLVTVLMRTLTMTAPAKLKAEVLMEWQARLAREEGEGDGISAAAVAGLWARLASLELDPEVSPSRNKVTRAG